MDRDLHVLLVAEVEKHECLYNSRLPEYAMKKETDEAWLKISKNLKIPVNECKDKWRNIRSTFRRSFKPSRSAKPKRTYYLSRYLNFIVPFSKPMEDSIFQDDTATSQDEDSTVMIKEEESDDSTHGDDELPASSPEHTWQGADEAEDVPLNVNAPTISHISVRNEIVSSEEDFSLPEHLRVKPEQNAGTLLCRSDKEHVKYFFLSLLPEFSSMSEQQIRTFKIKVLQLIDEMKTDPSTVSSSR